MTSKKPGRYQEQKCSQLLSREENCSVLQLLGPKCQSLAMAVVQFFSTDGPEDTQWHKKNFGILSFVRDSIKRSYYFRLYCLVRHQLLWEHEMYNELQYQNSTTFFHFFEAEECIVGFNFASEDEASMFKETVINLQKSVREKRLEQQIKWQKNAQNNNSQPRANNSYESPIKIKEQLLKWHNNAQNIISQPRANNSYESPIQIKGKNHKNKKYTKDQIGKPENFRHLQHIGWSPDKGFDLGQILDPELNKFFLKAGVSESQLRNPKTRSFIYAFINDHGGVKAVKEDKEGTPTPPPLPTRLRHAPPPPPSNNTLLTSSPFPPRRRHNVADTIRKQNDINILPSPPQFLPSLMELPKVKPVENQLNSRSALLDTKGNGKTLKDVEISNAQANSVASMPDSRNNLLKQIRQGVELKSHVEISNTGANSIASMPDSRNNLLKQIRQGVELKSVQPIQKKSNNFEMDDLAGALARALSERARVFHSDSSSSDSSGEPNEDDWDD